MSYGYPKIAVFRGFSCFWTHFRTPFLAIFIKTC
jgi:hypothetical protein